MRSGTKPFKRLKSSALCAGACFSALLLTVGCAGLPAPPAAAPAPASAAAGGATIVAIAPPSPPAVTLPQFLGLDVAYGGITTLGQRVRNRLGTRFPGLEARPPVRSLTDPANSEETASPAVQAAAEAKAEQDAVPQKAKAIRFLATLGCGKCFPDTENALLAALDDCNELIRYETVRGLRKSLGSTCHSCREKSCCTPKLTQKLYQIGYGVDENGCHLESSARVRRNARLALCGCGGLVPEQVEMVPIEGPLPVGTPIPGELPAPVPMSVDASPLQESSLSSNGASEATVVGGGLAMTEQVSSVSVPLGLPADVDLPESESPTKFVMPADDDQDASEQRQIIAEADPADSTRRE